MSSSDNSRQANGWKRTIRGEWEGDGLKRREKEKSEYKEGRQICSVKGTIASAMGGRTGGEVERRTERERANPRVII